MQQAEPATPLADTNPHSDCSGVVCGVHWKNYVCPFWGIWEHFRHLERILTKHSDFPRFPRPQPGTAGGVAATISHHSQPRPPIIMIIIDRWTCVASIIIIIIGGRGCGLGRYCDHELASRPGHRKSWKMSLSSEKVPKVLQKWGYPRFLTGKSHAPALALPSPLRRLPGTVF